MPSPPSRLEPDAIGVGQDTVIGPRGAEARGRTVSAHRSLLASRREHDRTLSGMEVQAVQRVLRHNDAVEIAEHIEALRQQGESLADAAGRAGLDAPVPPCAPWRVKDLIRHIGFVHRWAASHVTEPRDRVVAGPSEAEIRTGSASDAELLGWFRDGHAALVLALQDADPALCTATFMDAPSPVGFWARRQAHETAIHRADAESATGMLPEFPADFAADGIDELIMGFGWRRKYRPDNGREGTLRVSTADTGSDWYADLRQGRAQPRRGDGAPQPADCTVSGPASAVYLFLWNRAPVSERVTVSGDLDVLTTWQPGVRVR